MDFKKKKLLNSLAITYNLIYHSRQALIKNKIWDKSSFTLAATGQLVHLAVTSVDGTEVNGVIYFDGQQSTQNNSASGTVNISAQIP